MLSRRSNLVSRSTTAASTATSATNSKPCDKEHVPSTSSSSGTTKTALARNSQKRKNPDEDPHNEHGSEYLRRKHNYVKSTITVDYDPNICKDYKETGFCGFGDSCKFLHDRTDYKSSWQMDQAQEEEADDAYVIRDEDEQEGDDNDGTKCPICKELFNRPVVTKCKHQFCEACAEKECLDKCYTCSQTTSGILKIVKDNTKKK